MKQIINSKLVLGLVLTSAAALAACSDDFLQEKRNYDTENKEIYNYYSSANARISDLYQACNPNIQASRTYQFPSMGYADEHSQATEEYTGFSPFVDPQKDLNTMSGNSQCPDYFTYAYQRIRNVNDAIQGIEGSTLTQDEKDELLGQAYFFRAWCYYYLVRYYGGVPYVKTVQDPVAGSVTPRSTTKECIGFICEDLDKAAAMLHKKTVEGRWSTTDYGKVTTATALALKGRVLNLWASPLFNRSNDPQRWEDAYNFQKEALNTINSCGFGLAYEGNPGVNGSGWAMTFLDLANSVEGIYVTRYNTHLPDQSPDYQRNNLWEQGARPANTLGNNGKVPSAAIVDLFPMSDGKRPATYDAYSKLDASSISYDAEHPFLNRDPRFYRTFAFPGVYWRFQGNPNSDNGETCNPYTGEKYVLWNYVWYNDPAKYNDVTSGDCWGADNLLANAKGMYIRKFSDDLDVNASPNYKFMTSGKQIGFRCNQTSTFEIRYAEVLLNFAEAACMTNHMPEAVAQLQRIRARAGYKAEDGQHSGASYGLQNSLSGDQQACMAAILYERQIEFAYEGKRAEDMRRWLLYDGGTGFAAIGGRALTGWGGNTLTWLGFKSPVGTRRENMEFRLKDQYNYTDGTSGREWKVTGATPAERENANPDPVLKANMGGLTRAERDAYAVDLSESAIKTQPLAEQLDHLKEFYDKYLVRKTKKGDAYDSNNAQLTMTWKPRYYFFGLTQGNQDANPTLPQTVGWEDSKNAGANGTFDPAAEE